MSYLHMKALADVVVVLVRTQGPVNLGLSARACANLGVGALRLVAPQCEIDCDDARKFANHAKELLLEAPVYGSLDAAVADCGLAIGTSARPRDAELGAMLPPERLPELLARRPAGRTALVFGNEAAGLNAAELQRCQATLHLETPGSYPSYNLSHAVAIACYQLALQRERELPSQEEPAAARGAVDSLERYWLGTLERFRDFRRSSREAWAPQFAQMLNRMHLTPHDVDVLRGMLAQFNYVAFGDKAEEMADGEPGPRLHD